MKRNLTESLTIPVPKGFRAYKLPGVEKTIISKKGGPSFDQIKTSDSYKPLRDNQKEFGVASIMAKTLRNALSMTMSEISESYVSGRLTAKFRNLAKYEEGKTGTRPLYVSKHGHHLSGFEFNTAANYEEIFGAPYFIKPGSERGQVILHFPGFIPDETFVKPEGATNFKIGARLIAISDYQYDEATDAYQAVDDELNGKYGSFESKMFPLLKIPVDPLTTMVSINAPEFTSNAGLFLVMSLSFFKYENGKFLHLSEGSAMSIKRVY